MDIPYRWTSSIRRRKWSRTKFRCKTHIPPNQLKKKLKKNEIGKISKNMFDKINRKLWKTRALNQWKITKALSDWFAGIEKNQSYLLPVWYNKLLPLYQRKLIEQSNWNSKQHVHIKVDEIKISKHYRKSLLFHNNEKENNGNW